MKLIDNKSGNFTENIILESIADKYKMSYNCSNIGSGKSYIRIYATLSDGSYKTYFMPIQFVGKTEIEFTIDSNATVLEVAMIGDALLTEIVLEEVVNATMEYVKANKEYWDRIKDVTNNVGKLRADTLEGLINLTLNAFANASGTITQEDGVMTFLNGTTVANSTQAVQVTGGAIRIAGNKLLNGEWDWSVAITGAGINADAIVTGTLRAIDISGVNIIGSSITSGTITGVEINGSIINGGVFKSGDLENGNYMELANGKLDFKRNNVNMTSIENAGFWIANNQGQLNIKADDISMGETGVMLNADHQAGNFIFNIGDSQLILRRDGNAEMKLSGGSGTFHINGYISARNL